ncbi:establishment of cell polarity protein [Papiliotrema laurentii]|uniref:Establishment of cell polarity protein n=1 Tax=Papiliotrema laurentii TaxID=5418 RepID=A0AAD9FN66_PAPLA|nr:establishment of cell polarity protein [Papiliotrema laurentii]
MATDAMAPTPTSDLLASLEKHNANFTTLLSLIPSKFYVAPDPEEADNRYMKNKKRKTGEEIKEHKKRAKQNKLDPANHQTAADLLDEPTTSTSTSNASLPPALPAVQPLPPAATITDLRARLQNKLEGFRKDRGVDDSDPQSRDALEAERRRRRGEIRDKRRNLRKEERRKAREEPTAKPAKTQLIVPELKDAETISYPAISLPSSSKQKAPLKSLSNPSQALAHLEKHNAKLASLPADKRKEIEERERWAKAEERAKGGKVADQEGTLKKAVKRLEKKKSKSGKEWAERKRDLEKSHAAAAKKRNDNIASRNEARKNKKMGVKEKNKAKTKGKGRPGFEGGKKGGKGGNSGGAGGGKGQGQSHGKGK